MAKRRSKGVKNEVLVLVAPAKVCVSIMIVVGKRLNPVSTFR